MFTWIISHQNTVLSRMWWHIVMTKTDTVPLTIGQSIAYDGACMSSQTSQTPPTPFLQWKSYSPQPRWDSNTHKIWSISNTLSVWVIVWTDISWRDISTVVARFSRYKMPLMDHVNVVVAIHHPFLISSSPKEVLRSMASHSRLPMMTEWRVSHLFPYGWFLWHWNLPISPSSNQAIM